MAKVPLLFLLACILIAVQRVGGDPVGKESEGEKEAAQVESDRRPATKSDLDVLSEQHNIVRDQIREELPGVQETLVLRENWKTLLNKSIAEPLNISGVFAGGWRGVKSNPLIPHVDAPVPDAPKLFRSADGRADFQITTIQGTEKKGGEFVGVKGLMVLRDGQYNTPLDVRTRVRGLYRWRDGKLILCNYMNPVITNNGSAESTPATSSDEMWDMSMCRPPPLTSHKYPDNLVIWMSAVRDSYIVQKPRCLVYMDLNAYVITSRSQALLDSRGDTIGLKHIKVAHPPPLLRKNEKMEEEAFKQLHMIGAFESVNCDGHLRLNTTTRSVGETQNKAIHFTLMVTASAFLKIVALVRQMEARGTQAAQAKASLYTIGMMAALDSYECLIHLTIGMMWESVFTAFATASFFHFVSFSIFGMRYMLLIWKAQHPQNFQDGVLSLRRELRNLYLRFYGAMVVGLMVISQLNSAMTAIFLLHSFWLPQIIDNARRGCKRALSREFIVTSSIVRLMLPLYFYMCPSNFLHLEPHPQAGLFLIAWMAAQVAVLHFQDKLGPRFFVPRQFIPNHYEYYQRFNPSLERDGIPDCVICMCPLIDEENGVMPGRRAHMKTPCGHWFHTNCLSDWLEIKLECPTCRTTLPEPS